MVQLSHPYMTTGKTIALTRWTFVSKGFPCGSASKESACNAGDLGSIPGLGRSPEEEKGYPLQYSGLENSMYYIVHVSKSRTQLSDFLFTSPSLQQSNVSESQFPHMLKGNIKSYQKRSCTYKCLDGAGQSEGS